MSPPNAVRQGLPSRTAHAVALLRAAHQLLDEPLVLADPVALAILDAPTRQALHADPFVLNDPLSRALRAAVVARSRYAEDELAARVAAGVRQYVLLGAGLDTGAWRHAGHADGLRVFELDHPGTQRWKQQLLAAAGLGVPASLRFVAVDLERDDLRAALAAAGFRADQPACVVWMGVTMYLGAEAVLQTLRDLAGLAAGSSVCFDFRLPASQLGPVDRVVDETIAERAGLAGEPWRSAFDASQLRQRLLALGFAGATCCTPEDLNARYFARRKDGLQVGGSLRLMHAVTGSGQPG